MIFHEKLNYDIIKNYNDFAVCPACGNWRWKVNIDKIIVIVCDRCRHKIVIGKEEP